MSNDTIMLRRCGICIITIISALLVSTVSAHADLPPLRLPDAVRVQTKFLAPSADPTVPDTTGELDVSSGVDWALVRKFHDDPLSGRVLVIYERGTPERTLSIDTLGRRGTVGSRFAQTNDLAGEWHATPCAATRLLKGAIERSLPIKEAIHDGLLHLSFTDPLRSYPVTLVIDTSLGRVTALTYGETESPNVRFEYEDWRLMPDSDREHPYRIVTHIRQDGRLHATETHVVDRVEILDDGAKAPSALVPNDVILFDQSSGEWLNAQYESISAPITPAAPRQHVSARLLVTLGGALLILLSAVVWWLRHRRTSTVAT